MEQIEQPMQSESITELAMAVSAMQQTELFAITSSENPFFRSKYADLSSVWQAIRKPMTKNGLAIIQTTEPYPDGVVVVTTMTHKSGEWIRGRLAGTIVPDKKGIRTPQGLLSLITYLRRAGVSAITGVCPEDDDGESIVDHATTPAPKKVVSKKDVPKTAKPVVPVLDTSALHEFPSGRTMMPVTYPSKLADYVISDDMAIMVKQFDDAGTHYDVNGSDVWVLDGKYYSSAKGFHNPPKCVHVAVVAAIKKFGIDAVRKAYPKVSMFGDD